MKIRIINPNTTWSMTEKIGACARAVARPGTEIVAVSPSMGPASIESHYDEALAVPGLLQEIARGEAAGVDGYVIACFGDPGLKAARELARGPVVGIAEAAMHLASMVGTRFSVRRDANGWPRPATRPRPDAPAAPRRRHPRAATRPAPARHARAVRSSVAGSGRTPA